MMSKKEKKIKQVILMVICYDLVSLAVGHFGHASTTRLSACAFDLLHLRSW